MVTENVLRSLSNQRAHKETFMKSEIYENTKRTLTSPLFIITVLIMVINDHMLKGAGILPPWITGKLSDLAFLFFVPVVIAFVCRVRTRGGLIAAYAVIAILFAAINLSPWFSQLVEKIFGLFMIPMRLWPDSTDLLALAIMPLSLLFVLRRQITMPVVSGGFLRFTMAVICFIACAATSPQIKPTHEPVYMSWEKFRSSVEVLPPRKILKRGKIYVKDQYLYVNEPNVGIHVIDNTDPSNPVQKCLISIPGNIDLAIRGSYLYTDSYVDLLVFALTVNPEDIVLIRRIKDVFPYNPRQNSPFEGGSRGMFMPDHPDRDKGIVTGWRPIQER